MDRNRDARRASVVGSNGFSRRRHRTNSLRDSPDEDGGPELQESARLRERVKKDRDLRERGRERDLRERSSRSKRRRAGDDSSDESVNDEEEDEDDHSLPGEGGRFSSPASVSVSNHHHHGGGHSSSFSQLPQQHNSNSSNLQHRKTFPPSSSSSTAKVIRPPPAWKPGDEMISASVPRKARSASTKRSHDWVSSSNNSGNGDPNPPQPSISPAAPTSPSSSNAAVNAAVRKKLKPGPNINPGPKPKPPNASSSSAKPSSSNPEELEIEIAEVLYGLMTQSQGPPSKDNGKSGNSLSNYYNSNNPLSAVAPKRKKPRQVPEGPGPGFGARLTPFSAKPETQPTEQTAKSEISSPPNPAAESISLVSEVVPTKLDSESKDVGPSKELESSVARDQDMKSGDSPLTTIAPWTPKTINSNMREDENPKENRKEDKLDIDLMASPRQPRSSPERETKIDTSLDQKPALSTLDVDSKASVSKYNDDEKGKIASGNNIHLTNVAAAKESKPNEENKSRSLDFSLGLEKPERDVSSSFSPNKNKSQLPIQKNQHPLKSSKEEQPLIEKPGHLTSSLPLTMSVASWPPPVGYMAPLQGVVAPAHIQPLFSQPRPKRCATHCHIARNIHCLQQFMKSNPFWPAPSGPPAAAASLFSSKVGPATDLNVSARGVSNNSQDKACIPSNGGKEKGSLQASSSDSSQRKPQILIQQSMPSVAPTNLLGPAFIIPINQQQAAVRPQSQSPSNNVVSTSATASSVSLPGPMSFNYPNMSPNETQYLAFLQNNAYPFTIPTVGPPLNYRGPPPPQAMPLFNGSFYSSPMMHQQPSNQPSQMVQVHHNTNAGKLVQAPHNMSAGNNNNNNSLSSQKQQRAQNFSQWPPHGNHYVQGGGNDDNTPSSTADNRGSRVNIYGQNFAMPIHPQSFALMTPNVHQAEKKSNGQPQQGMKSGAVEPLPPPHTFAMSFGPGMDAQSHAMFQNCSESARQNMQMMAAAASAQKNNFRISEESKPGNSGNHDNTKEDDRKIFTFADTHVASSMQANNNVAMARNSRPATSNGSGNMNDIQNAQVQMMKHQQQMMKQQQQMQQMATNASNRTNKPPATSNGSIYSEHLNSSPVISGKFPNTVSPVFPQSLVQSSNTPSPSQSPQWKSSRTPSASLGSSSQMMQHKNLPQQHSRSQPPMHSQISFGGSKKQSATPSQGQPSSSHQGPSSPMMVGSPTTSSLSKGTSGSPRTNSSASTTNNKPFSSQPPKNSASILGNSKSQMQQQQKNMQQAHLFFSNPYSQPPHLTSAGQGGYTVPQRRSDQHQRVPSGTSTNDPATAIAAATSNSKGVSSFGGQSTGTLLPAGFSYVQVKPAEQKQPSGNDGLHHEKK